MGPDGVEAAIAWLLATTNQADARRAGVRTRDAQIQTTGPWALPPGSCAPRLPFFLGRCIRPRIPILDNQIYRAIPKGLLNP